MWWLCRQTFDKLVRLHEEGLVHGDMELHNIAVAPSPAGAVLIDFELAKWKKDLTAGDWDKAVKSDFNELLKEAVYLQCALGRQPGPLADLAMARIG